MSASALPPSDPAPERTPVPDGDGTPWERRAPERASLVADLTAAMEREPLCPFEIDEWRVEALADRLVRAGWRRVTEDDEPMLLTIPEFAGCTDRNPDLCACGDDAIVCSACYEPIEEGTQAFDVRVPTCPWLAADHQDQEWQSVTWHVGCDQRGDVRAAVLRGGEQP